MDTATILIFGANGQLGTALKAQYPSAQAVDRDELNLVDPAALAAYDWSAVRVIINAAAYTNVDGAETVDGRIAAWQTNATGAANLASIAAAKSLTLVHISSEYVFDGRQESHDEAEPFSPLGVYGQSKAAGDIAVALVPMHYIVRTSWLIGEGKNFVRTMLELGQKNIAPTVVADQIGRLTFTNELVCAIDHLLNAQAAYGTYNVSNSGASVSWAAIAREVFRLAGFSAVVSDTTTEAYYATKPESAERPLHSTLSLDKLAATGYTSSDWRTDLASYIQKEMHA